MTHPNTPTGTPKQRPSEEPGDEPFSEARYQTHEAELLQLFTRFHPNLEEPSSEANLSRVQEILERAKADVRELKAL